MSLTKTIDGMSYEATGKKTASKGSAQRLTIKAAEELHTSRLLWIVVKRHKVGLLMVGNIVLVLNWAFPEWPQLFLGLIGK